MQLSLQGKRNDTRSVGSESFPGLCYDFAIKSSDNSIVGTTDSDLL